MKNFWIVVGIIVVIGLVYFGGKALFSSPGPEASPTAGDFDEFATITPESTSTPAIVAAESPITNSVLPESPIPSPSASDATTVNVSMLNNIFQPQVITVALGDTVVFTNNDAVAHDVTFASFNSSLMQSGATYSHTFMTKGTYGYRCTIHPKMTGTVIVK